MEVLRAEVLRYLQAQSYKKCLHRMFPRFQVFLVISRHIYEIICIFDVLRYPPILGRCAPANTIYLLYHKASLERYNIFKVATPGLWNSLPQYLTLTYIFKTLLYIYFIYFQELVVRRCEQRMLAQRFTNVTITISILRLF